jgi:UDPglucose--hexose-1-phosphate uridylyltransferase
MAMLNLRKDPLTKTWVLIQDLEEYKPTIPPVVDRPEDECSLCAGNEALVPNQIATYNKPNSSDWMVRVIPHKKPKFKVETELHREGVGLYDMISNTGAHEIIVEHPKHGVHFADLPDENVHKILYAYKDRINDLRKDKRFKYILIFKRYLNSNGKYDRKISGHPYSELIATPITPKYIKEELNAARDYYELKERCIFCDILNETRRSENRIIYEDAFMLAYAPFAARFPFEIRLMPKRHQNDFTMINFDEIQSLTAALKEILNKIRISLNNPQYDLVLHNSPNNFPHPGYWITIKEDFHWHFVIIPKLFYETSYEWASNLYINSVPPERYSEYLRNIDIM